MKIMKRTLIVFLGLFIGASVSAQNQLMSPELLWKLKRVSGPQLSPDGSTLLFGVSEYDIDKNKGNRDLYTLNLDDNSVKRITTMPSSEFNEAWHPTEENKIFFLGIKDGAAQLFQLKLGKEPVQVTSIKGGINGFKISPKGSYISVFRDVKLDETVNEKYQDLPKAEARVIEDLMYRHWDHWHDYKYSHVFIAPLKNKLTDEDFNDIMKGEKYDCPQQPFGGIEDMAWAPDEKSIVYVSKKKEGLEYAKSTNSELYHYILDSKTTKNLTKGNKGYDSQPVFSEDGTKLAYLQMKTAGFESDKNDLIVLNIKSGEKENLTAEIDITVSGFEWGPKEKSFYLQIAKEATYQHFELNIKKKELRQITEGRHNLGGVVVGDQTIYSTLQHMNRANEIYAVDVKSGKLNKLTGFNDEIYSDVKKSKIEKRWITTTDGKKMLTWVIFPPDFDASKKYPTLLYCQGGPQSAVSQFYSFRWNFQLMAAQGYIVVAPNRRGLPSFGREWNHAISKDWGGQAIKDYLTAIDTVTEEPYVDKKNLGSVGASYGGYSVYYLAGIHEERFSAFISHCGLFNLESWYGNTEELFFANQDIGGPYWEEDAPEGYKKFSPHKFVQNWDTPIMVIHGGKDFRVPETEGMQAFQAAQIKGIPSKFLYFPEEGHWILSPQNGLVWHREFFGWLDKWLK